MFVCIFFFKEFTEWNNLAEYFIDLQWNISSRLQGTNVLCLFYVLPCLSAMTAAEILLELRGAKMEATIFPTFKQELLKKLGLNLEDACGAMTLVPYTAEAFCRRF